MHDRGFRGGRVTGLLLVLALALPAASPAGAAPRDDSRESVPSFNESPGCNDLDGIRGPLASHVGVLGPAEPLYGPWADYYGRTIRDVMDQLVLVHLPGLSKDLYLHDRVLPAFNQVLANLAVAASKGRTYDIRWDTWSFNRSTIPPTRKVSFHAVGAAIDVNSTTNPYSAANVLITDFPAWFVKAWTDAGWCWGGDWQDIKDAMHFSWKGPLFTPGAPVWPPQPPLVATALFTDQTKLRVGLTPRPAYPEILADVDRDGAVDVARLEPFTADGQIGIRIAQARHDYETCSLAAVTATPPINPSRTAALADLSGDGRPDLLYANAIGRALSFEMFTLEDGALMPRSLVTTGVQPLPGDRYLFDDYDRDGRTDLWVIRAGNPAHLDVWKGPGFTDRQVDTDLGVPTVGEQFALGDRDFDGLTDVYALSGAGVITIHRAARGFAPSAGIATGAVPRDETFFVDDLDGDGHPDAFLIAPDGATRMFRGGASTHDPGTWFVYTAEQWTPEDGCASSTSTPVIYAATAGTATVVAVRDGNHTIIERFDGTDRAWRRRHKGRPSGVMIIPDTYPTAAALVVRPGKNRLILFDLATGHEIGALGFGSRVVLDAEPYGNSGAAVLFGGHPGSTSRVLVRSLSGDRFAVVFADLAPLDLAVGSDGFAVLGRSPGGGGRIEVRAADGTVLAATDLDPGLEPVGLSAREAGYLVVARHGDTLVVLTLDGRLVRTATMTVPDTGKAAVAPTADGFAVARRQLSTGAVLVEVRDPRGRVLRSARLADSYDPLTVSAGDILAIALQRFGDGAAMLSLYDALGSLPPDSRPLP